MYRAISTFSDADIVVKIVVIRGAITSNKVFSSPTDEDNIFLSTVVTNHWVNLGDIVPINTPSMNSAVKQINIFFEIIAITFPIAMIDVNAERVIRCVFLNSFVPNNPPSDTPIAIDAPINAMVKV